jgi:ABC-type branched-subunit amino acid transport system permease subunit
LRICWCDTRRQRAIRHDEDVPAVASVLAFCRAASQAVLYAHQTSYVVPDIFALLLTLNIILALVAGGMGNNAGAVRYSLRGLSETRCCW